MDYQHPDSTRIQANTKLLHENPPPRTISQLQPVSSSYTFTQTDALKFFLASSNQRRRITSPIYKEEFRMSASPIIYGKKGIDYSTDLNVHGSFEKMKTPDNNISVLKSTSDPSFHGRDYIEKLPLEKHFNFNTIPVVYESNNPKIKTQKSEKNWSEEIIYGINI